MANDLMDKLMVAKAIMDKHNEKPRGSYRDNNADYGVEYEIPNAKYNIPDGMMDMSNSRITENVSAPSVDAIKNSKLPDAIKKLMIEHPIQQSSSNSGPTLSNELIEKASKLMNTKPKEAPKQNANFDNGSLQKMIEEAVNNALKNNGLLIENVEGSDDLFSFRVGKHIFEGKISKIKKLK